MKKILIIGNTSSLSSEVLESLNDSDYDVKTTEDLDISDEDLQQLKEKIEDPFAKPPLIIDSVSSLDINLLPDVSRVNKGNKKKNRMHHRNMQRMHNKKINK